jgi:hypothetical protein
VTLLACLSRESGAADFRNILVAKTRNKDIAIVRGVVQLPVFIRIRVVMLLILSYLI